MLPYQTTSRRADREGARSGCSSSAPARRRSRRRRLRSLFEPITSVMTSKRLTRLELGFRRSPPALLIAKDDDRNAAQALRALDAWLPVLVDALGAGYK